MSEENGWSLFCLLAFFDRTREECDNLEEIGRKVVERCKGLPLALKTVGGLLRSKETKKEWQCILDSKMWEFEEVEKGVFPPLLLSYYDLSPALRQCFSYCAIFPKDHEIEKGKQIKLWMAQGFVKERGNKGMEIIGEEYFNTLAMRSFFQDFAKDIVSNEIIGCKMHDIVHDFAQFLTEKQCSLIEFDSVQKSWKENPSNILHSMLMFDDRECFRFPIPMDNWKGLRTLLVKSLDFVSSDKDPTISQDLVFGQLTHVRALEFSNGDEYLAKFGIFPDKIGKLKHLRYLNLSWNLKLEILPEAICDLCNLQTLDITVCSNLIELPRGIGKLISLMYLENAHTPGLRFMPKGMERLTQLRTLKEFVVSNRDDACSLQALGKLKHLQGRLKVRQLGDLADVGGAREARLSAKTGLHRLGLSFSGDNLDPEEEALVMEALRPPPNLESLHIFNPNGLTPFLIPNWMTLKIVILEKCNNWESLPPMGKLPFLESLQIKNMHKVQKVGEEFLGIERHASSSSSNNDNVAFPNLKRLWFINLPNWEEWEYDDEKICKGGEKEDSSCNIMPRLQFLSIKFCGNLRMLPRHLVEKNTATMENLEIHRCPFLEERIKKGRGEDWQHHNFSSRLAK